MRINKEKYVKSYYKFFQDYDNNQISRPITSVGNDYNRNNLNKNNKSKNKYYVKKDIIKNMKFAIMVK